MKRLLLSLLAAAMLLMATPFAGRAQDDPIPINDAPLTQEERTDRDGRVFTERQILRYGLDRFENREYNGIYRYAIDLYTRAACREKERRFRRLPLKDRRAIQKLDDSLTAFDSTLHDIWYDHIGGGTAVLADSMRQEAHRQDLLADMALRWRSLRRRSPAARARFHREVTALRRRIRDGLEQPLPDPKNDIAPWRIDQRRPHLHMLEERIEALTAVLAHLPDGTRGRVAARIKGQLPTTDYWMDN